MVFGKRRMAGVVLCSLALIGGSPGWGPAAAAHQRESVFCHGLERTTYTPGLTLTPTAVGIHADTGYECTVAPGRTLPATARIEGFSPASSCLSVNSPTGREEVRYADHRTSKIVYDAGQAARVLGANAVRLYGTVVEGRGKGAMVTRTIELAPGQLPTDCLSSEGLRKALGQVQLDIQS
ncbi:hypothetical protein ACIHFE_24505 [Streptomyces sp. NPDC052396]|uniref:hypothetical protein n=1 Tax=Streptomyces sp. NPDC052396 TaxID=3365689 RepID=UPI0037CFCB21